MWTKVGLHNGSEGKVINFVYIDASVPRNGGLSEAVVVQFRYLSGEDNIQPFFDEYPCSVAIPMKHVQ